MSAERYIEHVTITTGDTRRSYRHEVSDAVVEACRGYLAAAEAGPVEMPGDLMLSVLPDSPNVLVASISNYAGRLITMSVVYRSRSAIKAWRLLTETASTPVRAQRPRVPWCAVRLEVGIATIGRDTAMMLGDAERCLAWAWLEGRR